MTKLSFVALFWLLTVIHICGQLRPKVNANILLKSTFPEVDKSMQLVVGYEFDSHMLLRAMFNSALAIGGVWLMLNHSDHNPPAGNNWQLFAFLKHLLPQKFVFQQTSYAWLLMLPWLLTFGMSTLMKYIQFAFVMHHFCESFLSVLMLYWRIQLLFLRNTLSSGVNYMSDLTGMMSGLKTPSVDFITLSQDLLN